MLTDDDIRGYAEMSNAYLRGIRYYRDGCVKKLCYDPAKNSFQAVVIGGHRYSVRIEFDERNTVCDYECTCPAYESYYGACKHVIAVLKEIQARWSEFFLANQSVYLTESVKALLDFFSTETAEKAIPENLPKVRLEPEYHFSVLTGKKQSWLEFKIGIDRMYVLKDIKSFVHKVLSGEQYYFGKKFVYCPQQVTFDEQSQVLFDLLWTAYKDEMQFAGWNQYSYYLNISVFESKKFKLTDSNLLRFLALMGQEFFPAFINNEEKGDVRIVQGRPSLLFEIVEVAGGLCLKLDLQGDVLYGLDTGFNYLYHKGLIYRVDSLFSEYVAPLLACFSENKALEIRIPAQETSQFLSVVVPKLEEIATVRTDTSFDERYYREPLETQIYLDRFGDGVSAQVNFKYGNTVLNPLGDKGKALEQRDGKLLLRAVSEENKVLHLLKRFAFTPSLGVYIQNEEEVLYDFLKDGLPQLLEQAEVFYSEDFKKIKIQDPGRVTAGVRLDGGTNILEMSLQFGDMDPGELLPLLSAMKIKKKYHRLTDGSFICLDTPEFKAAAELVEQLSLSSEDLKRQTFEIPKYRALYIDTLAKEMTALRLERNGSFKKMVQDIREPEDMEYEVPPEINAKLRDYQRTGFRWLKVLANYGMGGILADDMGLGKTLQVLTFLYSEKNEGRRHPSLVIAPTSLVYNWQEEAQRFAPGLKVTVVSGQQGIRLQQFKEIATADLVVTSYALIKRDLDFYKETEFNYCFLDEAQHIKNPQTLNAKSVKSIRAQGYFALTGTPIENTLTELWSIFDFLMPGYLRSHKKFTTRYEVPIVKNSDTKALADLQRQIRPFILRRMKKDVLKELPAKIEGKMTSEMTAEQSKVYAAFLMQARKEFEKELSAHGFERSQIKILALLTRLRQICCHPALFLEDYKGGSGKLDVLLELVEGALAGGHRLLLFSQFTGMLTLIKEKLNAMEVQYHYLDGSTKAEERMKLVNDFNAGEKEIFLISLKAGGTGLNLTGADMVIHYDPWWNPAVEEQATDRAYRIGQKNSVQVIKLITKGSIEEKIYDLQQMKKELIDAVIKPGENFLTKMSEQEIRKLFEA